MCVEHWLNDADWRTRRKACFNVISSTTNPTCNVLGWSRDPHGGMPASNQPTPWHSRTQYFSRNGHDGGLQTTILDRSFHFWPHLPHLTHRSDRTYVWYDTEMFERAARTKTKANRIVREWRIRRTCITQCSYSCSPFGKPKLDDKTILEHLPRCTTAKNYRLL